MSRVIWLSEALADLTRLHGFLAEKNPDAAKKAIAVIREGAAMLAKSPRLGRSMPDESQRRELSMRFGTGAYIIRYRLDGPQIVAIVRVQHSREDRS